MSDVKITKCPPGYARGYIPAGQLEELASDISHIPHLSPRDMDKHENMVTIKRGLRKGYKRSKSWGWFGHHT